MSEEIKAEYLPESNQILINVLGQSQVLSCMQASELADQINDAWEMAYDAKEGEELPKEEEPTEQDPYGDLIHANIEIQRDMLHKGLRKALREINKGNIILVKNIINAALSFHPMYAESWPGWPDETTTKVQQ